MDLAAARQPADKERKGLYREFHFTTPQGLIVKLRTKHNGVVKIAPADIRVDSIAIKILGKEDLERAHRERKERKKRYKANEEIQPLGDDAKGVDTYHPGPSTLSIPSLGEQDVTQCPLVTVDPRDFWNEYRAAVVLHGRYRKIPIRGEVTHKLLTLKLLTLGELMRHLSPADWAELESYARRMEQRIELGYCGYKGYVGEGDVGETHRATLPETGEYPWTVAAVPADYPAILALDEDETAKDEKMQKELEAYKQEAKRRQPRIAFNWEVHVERGGAVATGSKRGADHSNDEQPAKRQRIDSISSHYRPLPTPSTEVDNPFDVAHRVPAAWADIPKRYRDLIDEENNAEDDATEAASSRQPTLQESDFLPKQPATAAPAPNAAPEAVIPSAPRQPFGFGGAPRVQVGGGSSFRIGGSNGSFSFGAPVAPPANPPRTRTYGYEDMILQEAIERSRRLR
ncbi:hypothetical protein HDZ31DRAFT_64132 [Schizophyllum fasciatum]